jgi:CRP-like cAMP-binding protein
VVADLIDLSPATLKVLVGFLRDRLCDSLLCTSPLFAPFAPGDRAALAGRFRFLEVGPGHILIREGERADGLYVAVAGQLAVRKSGAAFTALGPGDVFGEMSLLSHGPATATVETTTKCYLLQLPRAVWSEVIVTHPQVLEYASDVAHTRLQSMRLLCRCGSCKARAGRL